MQISLSSQEWEIISQWADKVIRGGRWGDGMLTLGEEEHILQLVQKKPEIWNISPLELRVLQYWTTCITSFSPIEKELFKKIQKLTEQ